MAAEKVKCMSRPVRRNGLALFRPFDKLDRLDPEITVILLSSLLFHGHTS